MTNIKENIHSFLKVVESSIILWVSILAVVALLVATGLLDISTKLKTQIFKPTYIIEKKDFLKYYNEHQNEVLKGFMNELFHDIDIVIVDVPQMYYDSTINDYYYKNMTNGEKVYKYALISPRDDPKEEIIMPDTFVEVYGKNKIDFQINTITQKRGFTEVGFDNLFIDLYISSNYKNITVDSILQLIKKYPEFKEKPTFVYDALYYSRKVFSIISIDNETRDDVFDINLNIYSLLMFISNFRKINCIAYSSISYFFIVYLAGFVAFFKEGIIKHYKVLFCVSLFYLIFYCFKSIFIIKSLITFLSMYS